MQEIISFFGGKSGLAKALGVDPAAVSQWVAADHIPPLRAIEIEIKSNGKFKAIKIIQGLKDANS